MHKYGLELLLWTGNFTKDEVKLIAHAKELGFDGVEIVINHPEEFPIGETKAAPRPAIEIHDQMSTNRSGSVSSTSRHCHEVCTTRQMLLRIAAARNHVKSWANAQIRHGRPHETMSTTNVVRLRPNLSVIAPLNNEVKTCSTMPMLVISPIWPSDSPNASI